MLFLNELLRGNLVVERIESRLLEGNPLGDPAVRNMPVYLPPMYHSRTRTYPLLLALSGLFGSSPSWLSFRAFDENMIQIADRLIHEGRIPPMVIAFPDCSTRYGGSQYIDSTGTGPYMRHIVEELLPWLEQHYCVSADRNAHAVAGKSSGGFGALRLAMAHSDRFAHCLSSAGDLHFDMTLRPELAAWPSVMARLGGFEPFLDSIAGLRKLGSDEAAGLNVIALSSCYSPDATAGPGFALPLDADSGELDEDVFARWLDQDPVWRVTRNAGDQEALGSQKTLYIEAGDRDEYHADLGARVMAGRCRAAGIEVRHESYAGGHFGATWRWEAMLEVLAAGL